MKHKTEVIDFEELSTVERVVCFLPNGKKKKKKEKGVFTVSRCPYTSLSHSLPRLTRTNLYRCHWELRRVKK